MPAASIADLMLNTEHPPAGHRDPLTAPNPAPSAASPGVVIAALNRLIIAGWDESLALEGAALLVGGIERQRRLLHQALRRSVFRRDLGVAVAALGGTSPNKPSVRARLGAAKRWVLRLAAGPHAGDAYAVCARATANTRAVYGRALRLGLPSDVRFGIEHESAEIELDGDELARLRFGTRLSASSSASAQA